MGRWIDGQESTEPLLNYSFLLSFPDRNGSELSLKPKSSFDGMLTR